MVLLTISVIAKPVDGEWSEWSSWSDAPGVENFEVVNRKRTCSNPEPLFEGKICEGPEVEFKNVTKRERFL